MTCCAGLWADHGVCNCVLCVRVCSCSLREPNQNVLCLYACQYAARLYAERGPMRKGVVAAMRQSYVHARVLIAWGGGVLDQRARCPSDAGVRVRSLPE